VGLNAKRSRKTTPLLSNAARAQDPKNDRRVQRVSDDGRITGLSTDTGAVVWFPSGGAEADDAGRLAPQLRQQQQEQQKPDIDGIARRFAKSLDRQNSAALWNQQNFW
jgi:hypothetical protein